MRFLIRSAFYCFMLLVALPSFFSVEDTDHAGSTDADNVSGLEFTFSAMNFANGLVQDLGDLCERSANVCESGKVLTDAALSRAKDGLQIAGKIVDGLGADETTDAQTTASIQSVK